MRDDAFDEAVLERVHSIQQRLEEMSYAEAVDFAHLISREMPEEPLRMLAAELLMQHWRSASGRLAPASSGRPPF